MSESIIQVRDLSKSYTISHEGKERYTAMRDVIAQKAKKIFSFPGWKTSSNITKEEFWALKDINFEIAQGDRVGIIGRNGAGKSTLLKILSRIVEPTTGQIKIKGRVASLLEVGTGFHPELTGRENIFLNGAILGMSRVEIKKHFDAIVDFAEVEKFLDTPVKRYSSGMYVRLAFAVAAHLEPEILVVDEVLAVGDVEFQKKCLGKMEKVSKNKGRTVLFVSHNLGAIRQLCNSSILLDRGKIDSIGDVSVTTNKYLSQSENNTESFLDLTNYLNRSGNKLAKFKSVCIKNSFGDICNEFSVGDDLILQVEIGTDSQIRNNLKIAIEIKSSDGLKIGNFINVDSAFKIENLGTTSLFEVRFNDLRFYPDKYYVSINSHDITSTQIYDYLEDCINFRVIDGGKLTSRTLPRIAGLLFLTPKWERIQ